MRILPVAKNSDFSALHMDIELIHTVSVKAQYMHECTVLSLSKLFSSFPGSGAYQTGTIKITAVPLIVTERKM